MNKKNIDWNQLRLPAKEDRLWELFHENSKINTYFEPDFSLDENHLIKLHESLPVQSQYTVKLNPNPEKLKISLGEALKKRKSCRQMQASDLSLEDLSTLLYGGYGVNRPDAEPRPLRTVPSGGMLFPLEIYFYTHSTSEIIEGLYHYDMETNIAQLVKKGKIADTLAKKIGLSQWLKSTSIIVFITGLFERTTSKYGERGYRYTLLEAGHVAQNLNLTASALDLGSINLCGFYDRAIEKYLEIDGVNHSILYVVAAGTENL